MEENRYRLRKDSRIIGYMRRLGNQSLYYSKDSFWWTGRELSYDQIDEWCGYKDKNLRYIFEWDLIKFKVDPDGPYQEGVVLWEVKAQRFVIRHLWEELYFPFVSNGLALFQEADLEIYSYLFINPDLRDQLGLSE